ncbi:MAG: hypothetical protein ABI675_23475 [Chitinophagaceae bacterium]
MKKKIRRTVILVAGLILLAIGGLYAQSNNIVKSDKIIFLNGNSKEGRITAFTNDKVQFVHRGETLNYEFNKKEIQKIEYASGRTEVITEKKEQESKAHTEDARNKVAVLPLGYIAEGSDSKMDNMPFLLQEMTIEYLSKAAGELKFKSPAETNALLSRAGINESNIRDYTPKELAGILNVEYLIMGSVMQDKGSIVTVDHSRVERRGRTERDWDGYRTKQRTEGHGTSVTNQQIENQVSLSIYNESGESIYTKSRHSLISTIDGYKNTLRYLLKRTPLYER